MKLKFTLLLALIFIKNIAQTQKPKLLVGIVIDQMRWDYLYKFKDNYGENGFKRLLNQGFSCENTQINYVPTYTAIGHTSIYTSSVPALHGIAGNDWIEQNTGKKVYCTDDDSVQSIGTTNKSGLMSPKNLLASTITDELLMATNNQAKVIGVSLKDRAAILPAGHNPTGAYWFDDDSANFITSSYYEKDLPEWVKKFNSQNKVENYMSQTWNLILDKSKYTHSDNDFQNYEGTMKGIDKPIFPYDLKKAYQTKKSNFRSTPFGNTISLDFAKAAIEGVEMGQDAITDFLAINLASTDYLGHLVGPNALEIEDMYIRLDRDLADFFTFLDKKVGKNQYLLFISADHGGAHSEGYSRKNKIPTGFYDENLVNDLNAILKEKFGAEKIIIDDLNNQLHYDYSVLELYKLNLDDIKQFCIKFLEKREGIQFAIDQKQISSASIPESLKGKLLNGYNQKRSGEVVFVPNSAWLPSYAKKGTTHGLWTPYDSHIPLIFFGKGIKKGKTSRLINITDIAITLAQILQIQEPNSSIGNPILEVLEK